MHIHVGEMVKKVFDQQPKSHTIQWFAAKLNCGRGNIYDIFHRKTLDTELLIRISRVLKHDFFADISRAMTEQADNTNDTVQQLRTLRQNIHNGNLAS